MLQIAKEGTSCYLPNLVAVVTSQYEGEENMMAASWYSQVSAHPLRFGVAISKERYTYSLVKQSGAFAINFLPYSHSHWIKISGTISKRDQDKLTSQSIDLISGEKTGVPILAQSFLAYECRVHQMIPCGDHDWFVGDIITTYWQPDCFNEYGSVNLNHLHYPLHLGGFHFLNLKQVNQLKSD
ncbi:flavin reductase family protein [Microaerobacter geothermalis]|uniref:flavin reductase family protein n=1 Tax=Microaerobacter geothermalis TaxID=674972 RepID=UPI001F170BB8|nr:flavin reductase family protein [Microaerobacter geothermalis]MCF6092379.1 flavin reductase family protein [Microaerobacter geothermalis]